MLDAIGQFILDLPFEIRRWWRDGHTRTKWLYVWVDGNLSDPGKAPRFWTHDEQSISSHNDYRLWRALGKASDAILFAIVLIILTLILVVV